MRLFPDAFSALFVAARWRVRIALRHAATAVATIPATGSATGEVSSLDAAAEHQQTSSCRHTCGASVDRTQTSTFHQRPLQVNYGPANAGTNSAGPSIPLSCTRPFTLATTILQTWTPAAPTCFDHGVLDKWPDAPGDPTSP